jgi:hypothetical protein
MDSVVWGFVGTIIGAVVGAGASIITSMIAARNAILLQREVNSADRIEKSRVFQRETIIEVQDVLLDCMRHAVKAHIQDLESFSKGGEWGRGMLTEDVNEGTLQSNRKLIVLIERVADDELRSKLRDIYAAINKVPLARTKTESDRYLSHMSDLSSDVMEKLGSVLRSNY